MSKFIKWQKFVAHLIYKAKIITYLKFMLNWSQDKFYVKLIKFEYFHYLFGRPIDANDTMPNWTYNFGYDF